MIRESFSVVGIGTDVPNWVSWSASISATGLPDLALQLTQFNAGLVTAPTADFANVTSPSLTSISDFAGYGEGSLSVWAAFDVQSGSYATPIVRDMPITSWRFDQGSTSATLSVSAQAVVDTLAAQRTIRAADAERIIYTPTTITLTLPVFRSFLLRGGGRATFEGVSYSVVSVRLQVGLDNSYSEVVIEPV